jgi:hypothetical protein
MLGTHRWPRAGLLIILGMVLAACSSRDPQPPEPLDLTQPIAVDQAGQEVRFEFEMTARNFRPDRTYALELEVQHEGPPSAVDPDMRSLILPFAVTLQQWTEGTWRDVPTYDSYQAFERHAGQALPAWHTSSEWRYAKLSAGSDGTYRWTIVALPVVLNARYRLEVRTVQPTPVLQHYSTHLRIHAAQPVGK